MGCSCNDDCCESVITKRGEKGEKGDRGLTGANGTNGNLLPMTTLSYEETNILSPTVGDNEMFANIPIVTSGTYLAIFEADVNNDGNANSFRFNYYFMKNDNFVALGGSRLCRMMNTGLVTKVYFSEFITLTNTDTLNMACVVVSKDLGHSILSRSIKLLKIA